jgi:alanyl-tRNA synthetase
MGEAYPELLTQQAFVEKVLKEEEEQFARTLDNGMTILKKAIADLDGSEIPGDTVFKLYDTYGFPVDLTADIAREHELSLDMPGFERAMEVQRDQARAASSFSAVEKLDLDPSWKTNFTGYDRLQDEGRVEAIYSLSNEKLESVPADTEVLLVLDTTPFYAESGGQVGDQGVLESEAARFAVTDTQKQGNVYLHRGKLESGQLSVGDQVRALVAGNDRAAITLNHSATHLMNSALRSVLGNHVLQKGSLVDAGRLRFDFSHPSPLTREELRAIEELVNNQVLGNSSVSKEVMPIEDARKKGALALFGEKYGDEVRVVSMGGDFSIEFCGGCHVQRTGDIGLFKIISETGISAGVRRIEAVTGRGALALIEREENTLREASAVLKTNPDELLGKVEALAKQNRELERQLEQLKARMASSAGDDLSNQAIEINGKKVLIASLEGFNPKTLRDTVDQLKNKLGSGVVVLANSSEGKINLIAGVSKDLTASVKAGDLVNMVALQVGGKGGGRPDMAMAGGSDLEALPAALASVQPWLEERL